MSPENDVVNAPRANLSLDVEGYDARSGGGVEIAVGVAFGVGAGVIVEVGFTDGVGVGIVGILAFVLRFAGVLPATVPPEFK